MYFLFSHRFSIISLKFKIVIGQHRSNMRLAPSRPFRYSSVSRNFLFFLKIEFTIHRFSIRKISRKFHICIVWLIKRYYYSSVSYIYHPYFYAVVNINVKVYTIYIKYIVFFEYNVRVRKKWWKKIKSFE